VLKAGPAAAELEVLDKLVREDAEVRRQREKELESEVGTQTRSIMRLCLRAGADGCVRAGACVCGLSDQSQDVRQIAGPCAPRSCRRELHAIAVSDTARQHPPQVRHALSANALCHRSLTNGEDVIDPTGHMAKIEVSV
jgi:hypothetical protein